MFLDTVVVAGIVVVGLMCAFFVGFGYFIWKDSNSQKKQKIDDKKNDDSML